MNRAKRLLLPLVAIVAFAASGIEPYTHWDAGQFYCLKGVNT